MSIFGRIMDRIFNRDRVAEAAPAPRSAASPNGATAPTAAQPSVAAANAPAVDVEAVLASMAEFHDGGGNWRTSIVDLLKLLRLDSSLDARKELAEELGVNAGPHGSAEQNIALHKAVMRKLADNGGIVPDSLRT